MLYAYQKKLEGKDSLIIQGSKSQVPGANGDVLLVQEEDGNIVSIEGKLDAVGKFTPTTASVPAPGESDNGKILGVTDGELIYVSQEAGTSVVANPTLAGTEDALIGLQVGDTKYKVGGGGESSPNLFYHIVATGSDYHTVEYWAELLDDVTIPLCIISKGALLETPDNKPVLYDFDENDYVALKFLDQLSGAYVYKYNTDIYGKLSLEIEADAPQGTIDTVFITYKIDGTAQAKVKFVGAGSEISDTQVIFNNITQNYVALIKAIDL